MKTMTVYQTDHDGCYLYPVVANELALQPDSFNIPYGAVETEPPEAASGTVAQWADGAWQLVADNRGTVLYVAATGVQYEFGCTVEIDSASVSYNGLGPIPAWLSATAPAAQPAADAGAVA
ncbi:hypothetical protein [Burkholderia vietnamiensis]|uniref:hypothetical protein n=1 Tax=Burkholderia vietnamiensis TaxID=60552 RepID=UPI000841DA92|nr:hypothetical protein [Burkholderia vietnamiensis]AOK40849.1 hypothetical protein WL96_07220 [Burkholderia vietnamiensis]